MAAIEITIGGSVDEKAYLERLTTAVGASPARAVIRKPLLYADDISIAAGTNVAISIDSTLVFSGKIYDITRNIDARKDEVVFVALDQRQQMKTVVVGDPFTASINRIGQDVVFNEDGLPNMAPASEPPEFSPHHEEAAFWTFAKALRHLFERWLGGIAAFDEGEFSSLPHATEIIPQTSCFALDGADAVNAIVNQWGFGSWTVDPDGSFRAITDENPPVTINLKLHSIGNTDPMSSVTAFSPSSFSLSELISESFNNSTVLSGRFIVELSYYYYNDPNQDPGDGLLQKDGNVPFEDEDRYLKLVVNPERYSAQPFPSDDLLPGAQGKRILPSEPVRDSNGKLIPLQQSLEISIDGGLTWERFWGLPSKQGIGGQRFEININYDPLFIILPRHLITESGKHIDLDPAGQDFPPQNFIVGFKAVTEIEKRLKSPDPATAGNLPLAARRLIVREDLIPREGEEADVQQMLDAISTRAQNFEGSVVRKIEFTLPMMPVIPLGAEINLNGGNRTFANVTDELFYVVAVEYEGGQQEVAKVTAVNQLGEPANAIANAVIFKEL
jgi:hypothetical protein